MTIRHIALMTTAAFLAACSGAETTETASKIEQTVTEVKTSVAGEVEMKGVDLSDLPAGTYKSEQGHAYVAFQYSHQGYSRPIIRWGTTDATVTFDAENPENSKLTVKDDHIKGEGFFDLANHPVITFVSTDIEQIRDGYGTLTGNLTIKGVTKPFTLTGTVNKVGKHFRSGVDMFGVSATGKLKRSDFGVDKYAPMADDIDIMVEVEFQKAE